MCGVPVHAAENYLARLIKAGCRVAVAEQVETPAGVERMDTPQTPEGPAPAVGITRRSDVAALAEEMVTHWAEQVKNETTATARLEPWQR